MAADAELPDFSGVDLSKLPEEPKLQDVYDDVADTPPQHAATALQAAGKTGQSLPYALANPKQAQQALEKPDAALFDEIEKNHPVATAFLKNPANMAVAQHDLPNVAQTSQVVQDASKEFGYLDAIKTGFEGSSIGLAVRRKMPEPVPPGLSLPKDLALQAGGLVGDFPLMAIGSGLGEVAGAGAGGTAGMLAGPEGSVAGAAAGGVLGAGAGAFALPAAVKQALIEHIQKGNLQDAHDLLERTWDIFKSGMKQGTVGAVTGVFGGAAKLAGGGPLATLGAENVGMTAAGAAVEKRMPEPREFVENALVLGAMHGAGVAGEHLIGRWGEAKRVEAEQNFYKAMGQTAEASKLMKVLPEAHQDLIRRLTDNTPVSNVYVPVDAWDRHFQQSGFAPDDAAARMGVGPSYTEARSVGGDVQVPLDTYVSKLVGTKHYEALAGDVKFQKDGITLNQLNERAETQRKNIEQVQKSVQPEIEKDVKTSDQVGSIFKGFHDQLVASGVLKGSRQYEQKMKDAATLYSKWIATEATRRGIEPEQLQQQIKLQVARGTGTPAIPSELPAPDPTKVTIYLVRHGETKLNDNGSMRGQVEAGVAPLDQKGQSQAERLGDAFQTLPISRVYASDQERAQQTAKPISQAVGKPVETVAGLTAFDNGDWTGKPYESIKGKIDDITKAWETNPETPFPGGENLRDFQARNVGALDKIVSDAQPGDAVAVVTHHQNTKLLKAVAENGGPLEGADVKKIEDQDQQPGNVSVIQYDPATKKFSVFADNTLNQVGDLLERKAKTVTWEAMPSASLDLGVTKAPERVKREFTNEAADVIRAPDGSDELAKRLGIESNVSPGTGGYDKAISPNRISSLFIDDPKKADAYARALQFIYRQDAVPWFQSSPDAEKNGYLFTFNDAITPEKEREFFDRLGLTKATGYTKLNDREIAVVNYDDKLPNAEFLESLDGLATQHGKELGIGSAVTFGSTGDYGPVHDWKDDPKGEALLRHGSLAGSPDLQAWLSDRQAAADEIARRWSAPEAAAPAQEVAPALRQEQQQTAEPFYDPLYKAAETKLGNSATPEQVRALTRDLKEDNVKWSGLDDFLKGKSKVSKPELLDFLKANRLKIEEVRKGGGTTPSDAEFQRRVNEEFDRQHAAGEEPDRDEIEADIAQQMEETGDVPDEGGTKYADYTLPGGENYRELLFTLPPESPNPLTPENQFRSSHFDESNIFAHTRFDDRTDADGKKMLFLEEIQSDWHQKGRREGYQGEGNNLASLTKKWDDLEDARKEKIAARIKLMDENYPDGAPDDWETIPGEVGRKIRELDWTERNISSQQADIANEMDRLRSGRGAVPNAPFKKTWHEFVLKRMLRYAAEHGYDKIGWTTGEQQAERYSLDKQVDKLAYDPESQTLEAFRNGSRVINTETTPEGLKDIIGQEAAKKLLAQPKREAEKITALPEGARPIKLQDGTWWVSDSDGNDITEPGESYPTAKAANDAALERLNAGKVRAYRDEESGKHVLSGLDLKLGGEGMRGFYDKIVPDYLKKFGKKWGATVGESDINTDPQGERNLVHSMDLTPQLRDAALKEGFPLYQGGERETLGEYDPQRQLIKFFKSADETTIPHELAHAMIENAFQHVRSGNATMDYLDHWKPMAEWLGVKDDQERLTRDQHEKFARGFEKYLMEGKAPSDDLKPVFFRMAQWMTNVYRQVKNAIRAGTVRSTDLSDPARAFMDRLLASDDEIANASQDAGYNPAEIANIEGADPELQNRVRTLQERAHEKAVETLVKQQMEELKGETKLAMDKERERQTGIAEGQVDELPLYRAMSDVEENRPGPRKSAHSLAQEFLADKLSNQERGAFMAAADVHGFADGHDLATSIIADQEAGGRAASVKMRVDKAMEPFATMTSGQALREAATAAIHNDQSTELLSLEQQILDEMRHKREVSAQVSKRRASDAREAAQNAKQNARDILAQKPIKESGAFRPYITAERNAAVRAAKAIAAGDFDAAAKAKSEQMMSHALYAEAYRNSKEIAKGMRYIDRFAKRGDDMLGMPYGFVSQIDDMLAANGLAQPRPQDRPTMLKIAQSMADEKATPDQIANATGQILGEDGKWRRETPTDFVKRVNESYYAMDLPNSVLMQRQSFPGGMSLGDFRDILYSTKMIAGIGKNFDRFMNDFIKSDIKTAAHEMAEKATAMMGNRHASEVAPGHTYDARWKEKLAGLKDIPTAYLNDQKTLLTLCNVLDGGEPDGPFKKYLYRPLLAANGVEENGELAYVDEMNKIMQKHYEPKELAAYKKQGFRFDFIKDPNTGNPRTFFKDELLAIARNLGNEGNRDRIMRGFGIDEDQVKQMLAPLSKKDWDATQDIWNHLHENYWPKIVRMEMKVNGIEPQAVQATPVETPFGNYKGGYYPLAYDFDKNLEAYRNEAEKNALYKQFSAAAAHTDHGHTKMRVQSLDRPVRLHADVLINHLANVNHDLAFRESIIDSAKLLRDPELRGAIVGAIGKDGLKTIEDHIRAVASSQSEFVDGVESGLRWFRYKSTLSMLGLRPAIFPLRLSGDILNTFSELGPARALSAIKGYWLGDGSKDFVDGKSDLMKNRSETWERDAFDVARSFEGQSDLKKAYVKYAFVADTFADRMLTYPMWTKVYQDALQEHGDERAAVARADEAIVKSFGSGRELDKVEAQRGSEWRKATSMFMSWNTMMFNRWLTATGIADGQFYRDNPGAAAATLTKAAVTVFVIPALYESVMREAMRNGGQFGDADSKRRMLARMIESPFGFMWIARDIAPILTQEVMHTGRQEFKASPEEDAMQTLLDVAKGDKHVPENLGKSASLLTGYPQTLNTYVTNYIDWLNGNGEASWRDMISPRRKK